MRFIHQGPKAPPKIGDRRNQEAFLLLPKRILDETRFLENAVWEEKYLETMVEGDPPLWVPINWVNA